MNQLPEGSLLTYNVTLVTSYLIGLTKGKKMQFISSRYLYRYSFKSYGNFKIG